MKVLKAITVIYLLGLAIFTTSIIYSAVQMATDVDADVTDPEGYFYEKNGKTHYNISSTVSLENNGFYDIDDLEINIGYKSQSNESIEGKSPNPIGTIEGGKTRTFTVNVTIANETLDYLLNNDDNLTISLKIKAKYVIFGATFEATLEDLEWEGVFNHFDFDVTPAPPPPPPTNQAKFNVTIGYNGSLDADPTQLIIEVWNNTDGDLLDNITVLDPNFNEAFPVTISDTNDLTGTQLRFELKFMYTVEGVEFVYETTVILP